MMSPYQNPTPFIGTWNKQYGANSWMSMIDPLNKVGLVFQDKIRKKKRRQQKGEGAEWLGYLLGPRNVFSKLKKKD